MFGRFLELGCATRDISASVQFYEQLGFKQLITGDAYSHCYGVLSDGRLQLGLHECAMPTPALTFVLPELARAQPHLANAHAAIEQAQLGEERLNQLRLRDPAGHAVLLLEARTFSPAPPTATQTLCGHFLHLSLPQSDFEVARSFWESAGFIAWSEQAQPYAHVPLTSDALDLAFHRHHTFAGSLLVFECADLPQQLQRLRELNISISTQLPRGLDRRRAALLETPEGNSLLMVQAAD